MNNWNETTLGEVAEKIAMGPFGSNIKIDTFVDKGVPVISGIHLRELKLEDSNYNFITEEHANKLKNSLVYKGDVIFTHAGNIGQVAYIPNNSRFEKYIISQRQFYLRCNKQKLLPEYITYFFKTRLGQHKLLANSSQVGVPSIAQPSSYLKSISLNLPPVKYQKEITGVLTSLDDKIELLREENKTLEEFAQTLFKEWFVNFNFPGENGKPYKSSGGKIINSELGEIPEGWRIGKLKDIGRVITGKTPPTKESKYWGGDYPFLKIPDMKQLFPLTSSLALTAQGMEKVKSSIVPENSLNVSCIGTLGLITINKFPVITNQNINSIIFNDKSFLYYIYLDAVRRYERILTGMGGGSVFGTVSKSKFEDIDIVIPEQNIVSSFSKIISPVFEKIYLGTREITNLSITRDTILPKLMSGGLRVDS